MLDSARLGIFCAAALALLVVPGPAVAYIVTRSVDQGRKAGFVSVLGIHTGTLVHAAAAVVGVSAVIASSAVAFNLLKSMGAAYLIWIGVRRLLDPDDAPGTTVRRLRSLRRVYCQAVVVNVLNPKTALFFLAFLPQFVDRNAGSPGLQTAAFGVVFVLLGVFSDGLYALTAAAVRNRILASNGFARRQRIVTGMTYMCLGTSVALAGRSNT